MELGLILWFIGFVYASGVHSRTCEVAKEKNKAWHLVGMFFMWPHYLGYSRELKGG